MELKEQLNVGEVVEAYQAAWRADGDQDRQRLLEVSLTGDAELVQPNGRSVGREAVNERIARLSERWPGARVAITSGTDEHHGFVRYAWDLTSSDSVMLSGFDICEVAPDGRLRRVIQFFGPMPELQADGIVPAST